MPDRYEFWLEWHEEVERGRRILVVHGPQTFDNLAHAQEGRRTALRMGWTTPVMHDPAVGPIRRVGHRGSRPVDAEPSVSGRAGEIRAQLRALRASTDPDTEEAAA